MAHCVTAAVCPPHDENYLRMSISCQNSVWQVASNQSSCVQGIELPSKSWWQQTAQHTLLWCWSEQFRSRETWIPADLFVIWTEYWKSIDYDNMYIVFTPFSLDWYSIGITLIYNLIRSNQNIWYFVIHAGPIDSNSFYIWIFHYHQRIIRCMILSWKFLLCNSRINM